MSKALTVSEICALIYAVTAIVLLLGALGIVKYTRTHPPKSVYMKVLSSLASDAVRELETQDLDGRTKMHGVIKSVIDNLRILKLPIPEGVETIIENAAEHAVADMKNDSAIASGASATANSVPTPQPSDLPAENGEMITKGTAEGEYLGENDVIPTDTPDADTDSTDTTTAPVSTPVADTTTTQKEDK